MPAKVGLHFGAAAKSGVKSYTHKNVTGSLKELCAYFGINYNTVRTRMLRGKSFKESFYVKGDKQAGHSHSSARRAD